MPFPKGHKFAKGGLRNPPGGRPTREQVREKELLVAAEKIAEQTFEEICRQSTGKLASHFVKRAFKSDTVLNKAADKFWPDKRDEQIPTHQTIQFVQFNVSNNDPVQIHPAPIPATVLAGDGNGHQESVPSLASTEREGQDLIEFRHFPDVS